MLMQHIETNLIGSLLWLIYKQQFLSSCGHQLQVVWLNCRTVTRSCAFHASAPKEWNQLPLSLLSSYALPSFKKRLKTIWFSRIWKGYDTLHLVFDYPHLRGFITILLILHCQL